MASDMIELAPGVIYYPEILRSRSAGKPGRSAARHHSRRATPHIAHAAHGPSFLLRMTNCGPLGWVSDQEDGYRFQATHPQTGEPWPGVPQAILAAWDDVGKYRHPPEVCLVKFFGSEARMGLHQDRDEADFAAPVVSLSLG